MVKHLVAPLAHAMEHYVNIRNPDNHHWQRATKVIKAQLLIQDKFDEYKHDYFLPGDVADEVFRVGDRMLHEYAILHNRAKRDTHMLFKTLPNHHYYWHLLMQCRYHHPRLGMGTLG